VIQNKFTTLFTIIIITVILTDKLSYIQDVSGGIVNILGGGSKYSSGKYFHINMCPIFSGCEDTAV
jgi:hypothetical protein